MRLAADCTPWRLPRTLVVLWILVLAPGLLVSAQRAPVNALPRDTVVAIRTIDPIDSKAASENRDYRATVDDSVVVNGLTIAAVGTPAFLRVMDVQQAGAVKGRAALSLRLVALEINGRRVTVDTGDATIQSGSQGAQTAKSGVGGAAVGAAIGAIFGGKEGAAKGAAVGGAAGVTASVVAVQRVKVPAETRLSFTLVRETALLNP